MATRWPVVLVALLGIGSPGRAEPGPGGPPGPDEVGMVLVPAGEFVMGAESPEADDDERPVTRVFVEAFWIDRLEVTYRATADHAYRRIADRGFRCAAGAAPAGRR